MADGARVLLIRLGAMGDILHAMPAACSLRDAFTEVHWAVEPRWKPLLEAQCRCWEPLAIDRSGPRALAASVKRLRAVRYEAVVDLQGLLKSAAVARVARAARIVGFDASQAREPLASRFYSHPVVSPSRHIVDRYLDLALAAGAAGRAHRFAIPEGEPEGSLPGEPFVLASPLAGWPAKQWPLDRYRDLARRLRDQLGLALVLNVPPGAAVGVPEALIHRSGLPGLIHATRRARAVVGLDSGPMHLAAALGVPGVALFGPTDPERNGPVGDSFTVLRDPSAATSYQRRRDADPGMLRISVEQVVAALACKLEAHRA
jgi:heptosyltransferase-1